MSSHQRDQLLVELHRAGASELHHGLCLGADAEAHALARTLGLRIIGHPPTSSGLRVWLECDELREPRQFLVRNRNICLETELLIAAPDGPERLRSGTWSTIRYADKRLRMPVIVLPRAA
jgi:hypothetical protein